MDSYTLMMHHWYHVYADGDWSAAVSEHVDALQESGLISELASVNIGIVGFSENRSIVIEYVHSRIPTAVIAVTADTGWEQVTLNALSDIAKEYDGWDYVLYAHTKGVSHSGSAQWRESMTYWMVTCWKDATRHLESSETVGCSLITDGGNTYWGGNFWWARAYYLSRLPPVNVTSRYGAEIWVGGDGARCHDMNPGWPSVDGWKVR